ncbi:MAG: hypothetical protein DMF95_15290 [Acidobacteria bacterium]|nr:MAG: hypothetical protein DMF95_15290 [Acidobacteriota bacterium]
MTGHLKDFLKFLELNRNASAHTVRAYDSDLTQFLGHAATEAGLEARELEPAHLGRAALRSFLGALHKQGLTRASAARKLAAVRTFLRYLRREGVIEDDPGALVATPKRDVRMPAHLSEDEMSVLLDNLAGDHFSLVGFQTQIKWGDQARVLRLIPGLEQAEFVRFGMVHRNTYVNGPTVLAETWQVRKRPTLFFAGQMSGVEGYVESAASGLLDGLNAAALATGEPASAPPRTTAIGALAYYVSHADPAHYEPSNITFGIMQPLEQAPKSKKQRNEALSARALSELAAWQATRAARGLQIC